MALRWLAPSQKTCKQSGLLYIDNTNLWVELSAEDNIGGTIYKAQEGIDSWRKLLQLGEHWIRSSANEQSTTWFHGQMVCGSTDAAK